MKLESQSNANLSPQRNENNRSETNNFWRSLLECCRKSSDDVLDDIGVFESQGPVQGGQQVEEVSEGKIQQSDINQSGGHADEVIKPANFLNSLFEGNLLSESPRIMIWSNKVTQTGSENGTELYGGVIENQLVSVKKVPKALDHLAQNEVSLLLKLVNHENVIRFLLPIIKPDYYFIVTDHYGVSLRSLIRFRSIRLSTKEMLKQLINVTDFLHRQKILYMNFNPDNVHLVTYIVADKLVEKIVLTNFSHAIVMSRDDEIARVRNDFKGVIGFIAPETKKDKTANVSSDIFSLGCLFKYIFTGVDPNNNLNGMQKKKQAKAKTSDEVLCHDMIMKMTNNSKRPTAAMIKKHPYFWETHEILDLIFQVTKRLECNEEKVFKQKLELNKNQVFGSNWKDKIKPAVYCEVTKRRPYDSTCMSQLVFAIRNHYAHKCSPALAGLMGENETMKNYWIGKFPRLILHLCQVMEYI